MAHISLEGIPKNAWDRVSSFGEFMGGFYKENVGNLKPEALCISACTAGRCSGPDPTRPIPVPIVKPPPGTGSRCAARRR